MTGSVIEKKQFFATMHSKIELMQPLIKDNSSHPGVLVCSVYDATLLDLHTLKAPWLFELPDDHGLQIFRATCVAAQSNCYVDFTLLLPLFRTVGRVLFGGKS